LHSSIEETPEPIAAQDPDLGALYEEHYPILVGLAVKKFGIPETDAQTLAHEVFLDFLTKAATIEEKRGWLVGAICNASRYYLRRSARSVALPDRFVEEPDPQSERVLEMWPDQLAAREAFCRVTPRCQLALRLRYLEGYSIPEVAEELRTTKKYAQKLVGECLRQALRRYTDPEGKVEK
jgi:RNA polymerase sigma-70 factor (ECF subfamily)